MEKNFFKKAVSSISKKWKELTGQNQEEAEGPFALDATDPEPEPKQEIQPEPEPPKFGEQLSIDLAAKQEEPVEEEPINDLPPVAKAEPAAKESDDADDARDDSKEEGPDACEKVIGFNEETGNYLVVHYRRGFEARLIQANPEIKRYYSDLKNALLTYEGTKSRLSWTSDNFHNGRRQVAKINVKNGLLVLYLAIDPASLEGTVYRGRDVSDKKKYADTPFEYKIRTPRKLKWGIELIEKTSDGMGLTKNAPDPVDYAKKYAFETTEELVNRGLIKETMTEESPADISPELLRRSGEEIGPIEAEETLTPIADEEPIRKEEQAPVVEEIAMPKPEDEEPVPEETVDESFAEEELPETESQAEPEQVSEPEMEPEPELKEAPVSELEESVEPEEEQTASEPEDESEEEAVSEPEPEATPAEPVPEPEPPKPAPKAQPKKQRPIFVDSTVNPAFKEPAPDTMAVVDIDEVQGMYRPREVVNLLTLKSKSLVDPMAASLRVTSSSGEALPKPLKVEAERFTLSAMQAICLGGGDVVLLQWRKQ